MGDILGGTLTTNENGRTTLTGAGSDINFGKQIDKIIEAKRQPAVRLENRIQENQTKVDALNELQQRVSSFQDAADKLRGRLTVNNEGNVFENKKGFLSATRTDSQEPSKANSILTATIDNDAETGTNNLEVLQTAQRQRVTSDQFDPDADLGLSGDFKINGREVSVSASDSLTDIADGINRAFSDSGEEESVNASITKVSSNKAVLSLQGPEGEPIGFKDSGGNVLENLGVLNASGQVKNETQAPQVAKFRANGLSDGSVNSITVDSETATLDTQGVDNNDDLQFTIAKGPGQGIINRSVEFGTGAGEVDPASATINDLADEINAREDLQAEVVETDAGKFSLQVNAKATNDAQQSDFFEAGKTLDELNIDTSGDLELTDNGGGPSETVTLNSTETLRDVAERINDNTSSGFARVAVNSDGQESLIVQSESGDRLDITDTGGGEATEDLGLSFETKGGSFPNSGTGLDDPTTGSSPKNAPSFVLSGKADPGDTLDDAFNGGTNISGDRLTVQVFDKEGNRVGGETTIDTNSGADTLQDVRDQLNDNLTEAQASIVNDGGQDRLLIKANGRNQQVMVGDPDATGRDLKQKMFGAPVDGFASGPSDPERVVVSSANTDASGNANGGDPAVRDAELGADDADILTRKSNKVDDLFDGVTLNLLKAEKGTNVELDIERDLAAVKESINKFVESFNSVRQFINAQRQERALEGQDPSAENSIVGALKGETILNDVETRINRVVSTGAQNVDSDFSVLRQIGIKFVDNDNLTDPTREDTLKIDKNELDDKLLNDFNDVRNLFEFDFQSPNNGLSLVGLSENTGAADGTLTVSTDGNGNVDDSDPLEVTVDGDTYNVEETSDNVLKVQEGPLKDLTLRADLDDNLSGASIDLSTSRGVGFNAFQAADDLSNSNPRDGIIESRIAELVGSESPEIEGQNERFRDEIERIDRGLERERERLLQQFTTAEEALIELESAKNRLSQFAGGGSSNG